MQRSAPSRFTRGDIDVSWGFVGVWVYEISVVVVRQPHVGHGLVTMCWNRLGTPGSPDTTDYKRISANAESAERSRTLVLLSRRDTATTEHGRACHVK